MRLLLAFVIVVLSACSQERDIREDRGAFRGDMVRDNVSLTADEQPLGGSDAFLAREIRQAVVRREDLSIAAKNIKIIVIDGAVTLRGNVNSSAERELIENIARRLAPTRVRNELMTPAEDNRV